MDFQVRSLKLGSTHVALQLWDTAGQEFHSITQQYYRKADGILAMYDVTQACSFTAVRAWLDQIQEYQSEFFECSAKSGHNIQRAMTQLA
uniref:Si:ch211-247i17.1 n=1 Tax=Astyanax mexicanus TaxID=7994 RepID=W5L418_ASTMX